MGWWVGSLLSRRSSLCYSFSSSLICPPQLLYPASQRFSVFSHSVPPGDLFFWKKLHRVQVASPGSWLLQGPRAAVSRHTSWEIALSKLSGLYWLLFPSFGFWVFLRSQTLTFFFFNTLRGRVPCHALPSPPLTASKTTLSPFFWVQFPIISCLLNISCPTLLDPTCGGPVTSFPPHPALHT